MPLCGGRRPVSMLDVASTGPRALPFDRSWPSLRAQGLSRVAWSWKDYVWTSGRAPSTGLRPSLPTHTSPCRRRGSRRKRPRAPHSPLAYADPVWRETSQGGARSPTVGGAGVLDCTGAELLRWLRGQRATGTPAYANPPLSAQSMQSLRGIQSAAGPCAPPRERTPLGGASGRSSGHACPTCSTRLGGTSRA